MAKIEKLISEKEYALGVLMDTEGGFKNISFSAFSSSTYGNLLKYKRCRSSVEFVLVCYGS